MYVTQQNVVAYVPSELLLLSRLAATQDRMRAAIDSELLQLSSTAPDLTEFGCSPMVALARRRNGAQTPQLDVTNGLRTATHLLVLFITLRRLAT